MGAFNPFYYGYLLPIISWCTFGFLYAPNELTWEYVISLLIPVWNWIYTFMVLNASFTRPESLGASPISCLWPILAWGMLGPIVWMIQTAAADARKARENVQREREEIKRANINELERQNKIMESIHKLNQDSVRLLSELPVRLKEAEDHLDRAENDFAEGVYSPFWESVELAATALGKFDGCLHQLKGNAEKFAVLKSESSSEVPAYILSETSITHLHSARPTGERMQNIVRRAQKDPNHSQIYETRRNTQVLIAGFTSLNQAVVGLGNRIERSIDGISSQLSAMADSFTDAVNHIGSTIADGYRQSTESIIKGLDSMQYKADLHSGELISRHDRALEMLDNIQRRQKPKVDRFIDGFDKTPY